MQGFGATLRAQREARGISLEAIAEATCISVRLLDAVETENLDRLPGGVYNLSFIRQYASYLGLDADQLVADYKQSTGDADPSAEAEPGAPSDIPGLAQTFAQNFARTVTPLRRYLPRFSFALGVLLVVGTSFLYQRSLERRTLPEFNSSLPGTEEISPAAESQQGSPPEESRPASHMPGVGGDLDPSKPVRLALHVVEEVWVRAKADGQRVLEDNLRPGDQRLIAADATVSLLVGNAGGVTLALNGEPLPPIGQSGQVRRVLVDSTGMTVERISPKQPSAVAVRFSGSHEAASRRASPLVLALLPRPLLHSTAARK